MYGLWLATGGITYWLGMLDLGVATVMGQRIAAAFASKDNDGICRYYYNGMVIQSGTVLALMVLATAGVWVLPHVLRVSPAEAHAVRIAMFLASASLGLTMVSSGQKNTADALQHPLLPSLMNIFGRLATIGVTLVALHQRWGVYAIPFGMFAGAAVTFGGDLPYVFWLVGRTGGARRLDRAALADMSGLILPLSFGKAGDALVGQIEPTLIAFSLTPEIAVMWSVTKRAADIILVILDNGVGAIRASFAHLYAEGDLGKARGILNKFVTVCFFSMVVMLAVYCSINHSFIHLWVGERQFAGTRVIVLLVPAMIALHFTSSLSTLLGATGDFAVSSCFTAAEAVVRVVLMTVLLPRLGMPGLLLATIVGAGATAVVFAVRLTRRVGGGRQWVRASARKGAAGAAILVPAILLGVLWKAHGWVSLFVAGALVCACASVLSMAFDQTVRRMAARQVARFAGWKGAKGA